MSMTYSIHLITTLHQIAEEALRVGFELLISGAFFVDIVYKLHVIDVNRKKRESKGLVHAPLCEGPHQQVY